MAAARRARPQGKHVRARNQVGQSRRLGGIAIFCTLASVMVIASTAGSAAPFVAVQEDFAYQPVASPKPTSTVVSSASMPTKPLKHASRSDHRKNLIANAPIPATVDPNASTDTTPTLTTTQRYALRVVAPTSQTLNTLVQETLTTQEQKAKHTLALIAAKKADAREAAAKLAQERAAQQAVRPGGVFSDSASDGSSRGTNGYLWTTDISPLSAKDITAEAKALGNRRVPVAGGYQLSARFGQRGSMWSSGWHTGLDFDVPTGTKVVAAASGTIIAAGWAGAYGNRIEIDHGDGYITTYNHLSRIEKSSGFVKAGEEIGLSGSTGNTTGPHVHFEVFRLGLLINPSTWLWGTN